MTNTNPYPVDCSHIEQGDGSQVDLGPIFTAIAAADAQPAQR
ncbi:MAG: hypothetical protein AB7E41_14095 [Mycolicibacterium sp.]